MYRTIDTATWTDPDFRALSGAGKLLFLYLITNSHAHVGGIYYLPDIVVAHETSLKPENINTLWDTLSRPRTSKDEVGLVLRDRKNEVVWVANMLKYQGKGEKIYRSVSGHLKTLHNSPLIKEFLKKYPGVKRYFKDRVSDTPSRPRTKQDEVGIQEQEQEQDTSSGDTPEGDSAGGTSATNSANAPDSASCGEGGVADTGDVDTAAKVPSGPEATAGKAGPEKAKPKRKPRPDAKPEHGEVKAYFCEQWKGRYGTDYAWKSARDDAHLKWILDQVGREAEKAHAIIDVFLQDEDKWVVDKAHEIGLLVSGFNRYRARQSQPWADPDTGFVRPSPDVVNARLNSLYGELPHE